MFPLGNGLLDARVTQLLLAIRQRRLDGLLRRRKGELLVDPRQSSVQPILLGKRVLVVALADTGLIEDVSGRRPAVSEGGSERPAMRSGRDGAANVLACRTGV